MPAPPETDLLKIRKYCQTRVPARLRHQVRIAANPGPKFERGGLMRVRGPLRDAGVDREIRMREAGHADEQVADRCTHLLDSAHLAVVSAVEELVSKAGGAS